MLGYFESSFFLRVWSEGYSNWDASLTWTLECPRRSYSSDVFSLPQLNWARIMGRDASSDRMALEWAQGPANLLFWAGPHKTNAFTFPYNIYLTKLFAYYIELDIFVALNKNTKFYLNQMLFTICSTKLCNIYK